MDIRYQVFVSSTFADLQEERRGVIQTLMEISCIPAGMELFPAQDEEQLEFIKRVIDDCDYYLLIIGGRYGSTTAEGVSYTEQEYDYAISRGLILVFLVAERAAQFLRNVVGIAKDTSELSAKSKKTIRVKINGKEVEIHEGDDIQAIVRQHFPDEGNANPL
jgi:hypothetical protein